MNHAWRYHAVAITFWQDRKMRALPEDARTLATYLLTCPDRTAEGLYSLPRVLMLDHLGWFPERLTAALASLAEADFAAYDDDAEVVFIVKGLKYNVPSGPQATRGALKALEQVHGSPELFWRFLNAADRYAPGLAGSIRERYNIALDEVEAALPEAAQRIVAVVGNGETSTASIAHAAGFDPTSGTFKRALRLALHSGQILQHGRGFYVEGPRKAATTPTPTPAPTHRKD